MGAVPKHRHSTRRKGTRRATKKITLARTVTCTHCGKQKFAHRLCPHCGK